MKSKTSVPAALFLLAACASAPKIDYYTLAMEPSGQTPTTDNLVVERLRTTEALGRNQILISTSPTRIEYYATDHWAGSVAELVRQKLEVEFGPPVEGHRRLTISGTILAFEQVDRAGGAEGRLKLHIEVHDPAGEQPENPLLEKTYEVSRRASRPSPAAVVEALSQCVEQAAQEIAADVSSL
ncbi:MAG: ABC-type transport auxiliary lipoprotein family protein [Thermoanaerobaculales bacterium]